MQRLELPFAVNVPAHAIEVHVLKLEQHIERTMHRVGQFAPLAYGGQRRLTHRDGGAFDSRMALLYSDFRFVDHPVYGNNAMPGFPPLIVRGEVLYRFGTHVNGKPSTYMGPKFEWVPSKAPMDYANTVYNDSYAILGFKAGQAIDKKWSWFLDARNLTDKKYAATTNISANYTAPTTAGDVSANASTVRSSCVTALL